MKVLSAILFLLFGINVAAQKKNKLDVYLSIQYNHSLYDRTLSNNSSGFGPGLELALNPEGKINPLLQ